MKPKNWFRVQMAAEDPAAADLYIFDFIGDWIDDLIGWAGNGVVTAKSFIDELASLPEAVKTIRVHVNSPGGDVFGAVAIANALRDQRNSKGRRVEMSVEGLAASAASIVIQAGDPIRVGDNALLMIHDPWTGLFGNAVELRKAADELDTITSAIIATYRWHSELSEDEIEALMDATTWMDADAAIANGFATEKVEGLKAAASIDPRAVAKLNVPDKYRARVEALVAKPAPAPTPPTPAAAMDVLRLCREGECPELAEELVQAGATLEQVQARVAGARQTKAQAQARETEIRALCAAAKQPDLAETYIKGGMAPAQARAQLTLVSAKLDKVEIDGGLNPDHGSRKRPVIDTVAIYAELNKLPQAKE